MLVLHQAEGVRERAMAASLSYHPTSSTPLGVTARVAPSWAGQAASGAEARWGRGLGAGQHSQGRGGVPVWRAWVSTAFRTASSLHVNTAPITL